MPPEIEISSKRLAKRFFSGVGIAPEPQSHTQMVVRHCGFWSSVHLSFELNDCPPGLFVIKIILAEAHILVLQKRLRREEKQ